MRRPVSGSSLSLFVLSGAALALMATIGLRAQQAGAPARPVVPLAASSLIVNPEAYIGESVSMVAVVERVLTKTTFLVDQDRTKASEQAILVIAPSLNAEVELNAYVTVLGEVLRFDPADVARRARGYTLDLPADLIERFRGQPVVLATAVIDKTLTDIAKRVPPPLTPAEVAFDKVMKQVQAASTAMRAGIEASSADQVKAQTTILKAAFTDAQAFFKTRNTTDAAGWAQDALTLTGAIELSAASANWDEARTTSGRLTQLCTQCHTAHRERMEDGTFRVRAGG